MHRKLLLVIVTALLQGRLIAAQATEAPRDIGTQLARIDDSLRQLVKLGQEQAAGRHLELLLRRAELGAQETAPLYAELRFARTNRESLEHGIQSMESQIKEMSNVLESPEKLDKIQLREAEQQLKRLQSELEFERVEFKKYNERVTNFEAEIASKESERQELKAAIDRLLLLTDPR